MSRGATAAGAIAVLLCWLPLNAYAAKHFRTGLIVRDGVQLHSRASTSSPVRAVLIEQTQVEVLGTRHGWSHARIWASVEGWIRSDKIVFRKPWGSTSTYRAPSIHYQVRAHGPYPIHAPALTTAVVPLSRRPGGRSGSTLPAGSRLLVTAWRQDRSGHIWYQAGRWWARGDALRFRFPDPALTSVRGIPVAHAIRGKGMWLTLGTVGASTPAAIIRAARHNGITHLYVESAISPLGFHGRVSVGPLIRQAHQYGIAVVAWVYPYLYDIASDVALTRQVAEFRTADGDRFDGIAADLERNFTRSNVHAYSQLVRYYVGSRYLLVGVTYPPQSAPEYPFEEIGRDYNAVAPMDYWHQTKTERGLDYGHMRYGYAYAYRYAGDSIKLIRRAVGRVPIVPIGQTFDNFGRLEMGPHAPTAAEISGFLHGSEDNGAAGVSFFQWMTATDPEWRAIHSFRF